MGKQAYGQSDSALWGDAERDAELHELATLLSLASQGEGAWVFALYSSVATRQAVMSALQERVDLPFFEFTFGPEQVNPRDYLDSLPAEARDKPGVVCFCDLELALGRNLVSSVSEAAKPGFSHDDRPLVLGYLDLNRDWFARQPHSLLFWVTGYGRVQVATQAPNFWSRRNNVYDFRVVEPEARAALRGEMLRGLEGGAQYEDVADWRRQVQLYEKLLEEYLEDESPDQAAIADLCGKLGWLHLHTGHYDESRRLFDAQLAAAQATQNQGYVSNAWYNQAYLLRLWGDYEGAGELFRRALATGEELGNRHNVAVIQGQLADLLCLRRDYEGAEELFRHALAAQEELGDQRGVAVTQYGLAELLRLQRDYEGAEELFRRALATIEELGDRHGVAVTQGQLAALLSLRGDYGGAEELFRRALAAKEELGDRREVAITQHGLASLLRLRGDYEGAEELFRRVLVTFKELGGWREVAVTLHNLAIMRRAQGRLSEALELLARSRDINEKLQLPQDVARVEELIAQIRQQMREGQGTGGG